MKFLILIEILLICAGRAAHAAADSDSNRAITQWLDAQSRLKTWTAEVTQVRTLKALAQPLKTEGRVWFEAPNKFRWELGNPPQTIAVRKGDDLFVVYPRLERAERYPLSGPQTGQWRDALTLLEAGFPASREELERQFDAGPARLQGEVWEVRLRPKSAAARRMIEAVVISFSAGDFGLRATELQFADGSAMRNEFARPAFNQELPAATFEPGIPANFKIAEPLSR